MKKVLTIAGSDCSGGAGIQADLKTMTAFGVYGMSAIAALTAQNTTGVYGIQESTPEFLGNQLDCIFTDIPPEATKIGMLSSAGLIAVTADRLNAYQVKNMVLDPVMVSTSGSRLLSENAISIMVKELLPLAVLVTPNIPEAETLSGISIHSEEDMLQAAEKIASLCKGGILIKGGHAQNHADDLLYYKGRMQWFRGERFCNPNTHGTGCTLSSAIACGLAQGKELEESIQQAKSYVSGAIRAGLDLGKGSGPLNHCWNFVKGEEI